MTEQEFRTRMNRLTGEILDETHQAYLSAVLRGKDEVRVKRKIPAGLVFAIVLILLAAAAVAASTVYDMRWWFGGQVDENDAARQQEIMENRVEEPAQQQADDGLVDVTVQDVSWAPEAGELIITFRAVPKDPQHYELHSKWALDTDGSYMGKDFEPPEDADEDAEERNYHMLWRDNRETDEVTHGPVAEMMDDNSKTLLLIEAEGVSLKDGTSLDGSASLDELRTPDGDVVYMLDFHPDWLNASYDEEMRKFVEEYPNMKDYAEQQISTAQAGRETLSSMGTNCVLRYRVAEYTEDMDDIDMYTRGTAGEVEFALRTGKGE